MFFVLDLFLDPRETTVKELTDSTAREHRSTLEDDTKLNLF